MSGVARYGCFTPDTGVLMADGSTKPISDVQVGDQVAAFNPETWQTEPRPVTDTFTHEHVPTIHITTTAGDITTTATHPFYVEGEGWTQAGELQEHDQLRTPDGDLAEVISIQATGKTETVHNIAVAGLHNYHVQTSDGTNILVHNNASCEEDLFAFGNASGPRPARPSDFGVESGSDLVGPYSPTAPTDYVGGASKFASPEDARGILSGPYQQLPAGSNIPDGLAVHADGADVGGNAPWGHHTVYPTESMTLDKFNNLFSGLDWERAGKLK